MLFSQTEISKIVMTSFHWRRLHCSNFSRF